MKRVMSVYLPRWPLQRLEHDEPRLRGTSLALADPRAARGPQIVLCSDRAERAGVRPGMPVIEARAIDRRLQVREQNPDADALGLGRLAKWLERFSPLFTGSRRLRYRRPERSYRFVYPDRVDLDRVAYFFEYEWEDALPDSAYAGLAAARGAPGIRS